MQCTAEAVAVHCVLHASTSNLSRKYVHPSLQVRASEVGPSNPIRHTDVSLHHLLFSSYYIYPARRLSLHHTSLQIIGRTFCILGCTGA